MADWQSSMQQTFEYYVVDPDTWRDDRKLDNVKSCTISRDVEVQSLGSATFDVTESIDECYIRVYLVTIQNGVKERHPLGTFLTQTPSSSFNGMVNVSTIDAYTPLLELKESPPPLGYSLLKGDQIMTKAYQLTRENSRAPVVPTDCPETLPYDFVSNTDDTWLSFITDLINNAKYEFALDEMGRILFSPEQDTASLQPVWTYDDGNSSILYPEISLQRDLYGIPNVVQVVYSDGFYNPDTDETEYFVEVVNDDSNSPTSTISRGRRIIHRETNPKFSGEPTRHQIHEYAKRLLRELSSIECKISYSHGYCPTRLGDCVRLNYTKAGLKDVKAKVISQSIKCVPGCPVTEKAVFTTKLWG